MSSPRPMTPEQRLLLEIVSPWPAPGPSPESVARSLRWEDVLRLAELHDVVGQLAASPLAQTAAGELPPDGNERLASWRRWAFVSDQRAVAVLAELISRTRAAGIPFILLKGLGLAERLYKDPSERISKDVDLLVRKDAIAAVDRILGSMGFWPFRREFFLANHYHIPYIAHDVNIRIRVELHWEVTPRASLVQFRVDRWWQEARITRLRSGEVLVPPPAEELAHVAWHAFTKGAPKLRDLLDVARLWHDLPAHLSWEHVIARAEAARASLFLEQAMRLCSLFWSHERGLWPSGLPAVDRAVGRRIGQRFFQPGAILNSQTDTWWPYGQIAYWALLPMREAGFTRLFLEAVEEQRKGALLNDELFPPRAAARAALEIGIALMSCFVPFCTSRTLRSDG